MDATLKLHRRTRGRATPRILDDRHAGLTLDELEEGLLAIGDREDVAGPDARARLARVRRSLERELARRLAQ